MSLFSLRRSTVALDAPATPRQLDKRLTAETKPGPHLRSVVDTSQVLPYSSLEEARQGAFDLARRWGHSRRRDSAMLFIDERHDARNLPINDLAALNATVDANTAAIVLDAGCTELSVEYCQGAAQLCRALQILLIIEDRSAGADQGGPLLAERLWGIKADLIVVDSDRGPGLPRAAVLVRVHTDGLAAASQTALRSS